MRILPGPQSIVRHQNFKKTNNNEVKERAIKTFQPGLYKEKHIKKVRFADEVGCDLCSVKFYEPLPTSLYFPSNSKLKIAESMKSYKVVFNETELFLKNICVVAYGAILNKNIFGTIAVRNIAYEKKVTVILTEDKWKTSIKIEAKFVNQEYGGAVDRFFFMSPLKQLRPKSVIEFAAAYYVAGEEFWDNNRGKNYEVICSKSAPYFTYSSDY